MEKRDHFSNISTFMEKKAARVSTLIARTKLSKPQFLTEQLFPAQNAKNNKVDPNYTGIYTVEKNMPNTKSAIRRVRRVKKQTQINRIRKSKYKNANKEMDLLIKSEDKTKAKKYFSKFQSILMQVAKSGTVSKKTAARKISRISKKFK